MPLEKQTTMASRDQVLVEKELRPWMKEDLDAIEDLLQQFEKKQDFFYGPNLTIAWTRSFRIYNETHPVTEANALAVLQQFLQDPVYKSSMYDIDVKVNTKRSTVSMSRYFIVSKWLSSTYLEAEMMDEARAIADRSSHLSVTAYHSDFILYGQATKIWMKMLQKVKFLCSFVCCFAFCYNPLFAKLKLLWIQQQTPTRKIITVLTNILWCGLVWSGLVWSGPVRFGSVRFGPVRSGPVRSGPVRSGPVRSGSCSFAKALIQQDTCSINLWCLAASIILRPRCYPKIPTSGLFNVHAPGMKL